MSFVPDIKTEDLSTSTAMETEGARIRSTLSGRAETPSRGDLDWFLKHLHEAAVFSKVHEVVIDLRMLDFMTSSCFKTFVTWIGTLSDSPPSDQYKIRFLSDDKKHWQSRSLAALACFAEDLVDVQAS